MKLLKSVLVCGFLLGCSSDNDGDGPIDNPGSNPSNTPSNLQSEDSDITPSILNPEEADQTNSSLSGAGGDPLVLLSSKFIPPGTVGKTLIALSDTAMSESGWIAASGVLEDDLSDDFNVLREPAIWRGRDGQLELVLSEDTVINGFSDADTYSFTRDIEISNDGTIWARIVLDSTEERNDALVRISLDGQVQGLLKQGSSFNDNEPQLTVDTMRNIVLAGNSNKGFVFITDNNSSDHMVELNPAGVTVHLTSQDFSETVVYRLQGSLSHCVVVSHDLFSFFNLPQVTASGDFLMSVGVQNEDVLNPPCPDQAILRYSDGDFSFLFSSFDPLPGTVNTKIIGMSVVASTLDEGAIVSITTAEGDEQFGNRSTWFLDVDGMWHLLTVENESLPPDFVDRMESQPNFESFNQKRDFDVAIDNEFVVELEDFGIYTGTARVDQPYASLNFPGASQMNQLVSFTDESAVNFFFSASYVSIRADGSVWLLANTTSQNTGPSQFQGLWRFDENGNGEPFFTNMNAFTLNGEATRWDRITGYSLNEAGGVLIEGFSQEFLGNDLFAPLESALLYFPAN